MAAHSNLTAAKDAKNDEFYTELSEIQSEISNYTDKFKDKVVLCNCDDPFESNFVKYFLMNFNRLGLKELIATGYKTSPVGGAEIGTANAPYVLRVTDTSKYLIGTQKDLDAAGAKYFLQTEGSRIMTPLIGNTALDEKGEQIQIIVKEPVFDNDGNMIMTTNKKGESKPKMKSVKKDLYYEAGDFRSDMSLALLNEADIVCTNPPFSLFREFVSYLINYGKSFLILGSLNAISYKEIFPLLKDNLMWLGCVSGSKEYRVTENYAKEYPDKVYSRNNKYYSKLGNTGWYTNIDHAKRHQVLPLDLGFIYDGHEEMYPKYFNYDAINVDKASQIPCDYKGVMGIPITTMDKYCPEQFEIVGLGISDSGKSIGVQGYTDEHRNYRKNVEHKGVVDGDLYMIDVNNHPVVPYARILVRFTDDYINAHPEQFQKGDN